jgi:RNA polymerase sigma-70 factor, ECF subfamily
VSAGSEVWAAHRPLLFRVAYDVLGSVADAEDVVQETWLRWSAGDRTDVREPRAYLVRIAVNQALNRVRANQSRRETYVGPWLPEPLVDPDPQTDPATAVTDRADRVEQVSLAMLVVLESLTPDERAVFVLREVFGMPHDDIASAMDRSPAAVRQIAHRAREHVQARRPRFDTDADEQRRVTATFLQACLTGDVAGLLAVLAPQVRLVSDGGGVAKSARRVIEGADKVSRFMVGISGDAAKLQIRFAQVNGRPGVVQTTADGEVHGVAQLDVVDGRVETIFFVVNPDKLRHLAVDRPH